MNKKNKILALALSASFVVGGASVAEASEERLVTSESPILNENIASETEKEEKPQNLAEPTKAKEEKKEEAAPAKDSNKEAEAESDRSAIEPVEEKDLESDNSLEISEEPQPEAVGAAGEAGSGQTEKSKFKKSSVVEDEKQIQDFSED